jgi:hypothetical protein
MKNYAATFPTDEEIKERYYQQRGWDEFKVGYVYFSILSTSTEKIDRRHTE